MMNRQRLHLRSVGAIFILLFTLEIPSLSLAYIPLCLFSSSLLTHYHSSPLFTKTMRRALRNLVISKRSERQTRAMFASSSSRGGDDDSRSSISSPSSLPSPSLPSPAAFPTIPPPSPQFPPPPSPDTIQLEKAERDKLAWLAWSKKHQAESLRWKLQKTINENVYGMEYDYVISEEEAEDEEEAQDYYVPKEGFKEWMEDEEEEEMKKRGDGREMTMKEKISFWEKEEDYYDDVVVDLESQILRENY